MGEIKRIGTMIIYINIRYEHYPVHVHVMSKDGDNHYRVFLNGTVEIINGKLTGHQLSLVKQYVEDNNAVIKKAFKKMMDGTAAPGKIG